MPWAFLARPNELDRTADGAGDLRGLGGVVGDRAAAEGPTHAGKPFDGDDSRAFNGRDGHLTGAQGAAIDMDRAGAAQSGPTAEFRPGQPDMVTDDPQEWGLRIGVGRDRFTIQRERSHVTSSARHPLASVCWKRDRA
jgi:hypothetical protein